MDLSRRRFLKACGLATTAVCSAALAGCSSAPRPPAFPERDMARVLVDGMGVEEKAAQLFIVTPEQISGTELVWELDDAFRGGLQSMPVCGITYFDGNIIDAAQTKAMLADTHALAAELGMLPLFLCVDEEGGTVQRIGGKSGFDSPFIGNASDIGATGDVAIARESARTIALALRDLGFNVDFAPSCDIATSARSNMRLRSFGAEAALVGRMAAAQVKAFEDEGILCCAKHFPGIGDPEDDSHALSIYSNKTREELDAQIAPFVAAIVAGVPMVMVGHLSLPQVTGSGIPASISPDVVQGILRNDIGYEGVVVTDSLSMGALLEFCAPADVAVAAIEAGCDIALMPSDFSAAYAGLVDAINTGRIPMERIDQSLVRILSLKLRSFPELFDEEIQGELAKSEQAPPFALSWNAG